MIAWLPITLALLTAAPPGGRTVVLLSEIDEAGQASYWWHCGERPALPVTDELTPQLARLGLDVLDRCGPDTRVHKSYHQPRLKPHQVINLGNALGGRRVVAGTVTFTEGKGHPELGLVHRKVTLELTAHDLQMEQPLGTISRSADGFANSPETARQKAVGLLLVQLLDELPKLTRTPRPKQEPALEVRLTRLARHAELADLIDALGGLTAVRRVELRELTQKSAVLRITPPDARDAVTSYLRQARVPFEID